MTTRSASSRAEASYRYNDLANARIKAKPCPPEGPIVGQINAIFRTPINKEGKAHVKEASRKFRGGFDQVFDSASSEDDCIQPCLAMFHQLNDLQRLMVKKEAKWDNLVLNEQSEVTCERSKLDSMRLEQDLSQQLEPQVGLEICEQGCGGKFLDTAKPKTHRPDITVGIFEPTLTSALTSRGMSRHASERFLRSFPKELREICPSGSVISL